MLHACNVQIDIQASMDRLWTLTQSPDLHQRWDLRFTEIQYLPRPDPAQPQQFRYATRIGFGLSICGGGETAGSFDKDGQRTSSLRFWSDDSKSLIRSGAGYWQYTQRENDVRFVTGYGYDVRFGVAGRVFDRIVFRPLMGWATAWSFDRLRLWLEQDIPPEVSLRQSVVHLLARLTVAFIWLWHGLVPKLIFMHADELSPLTAMGASLQSARLQVIACGWIEIAIGMTVLLWWRARWPLWLTIVAMPVALIGVLLTVPRLFAAAFNPMTLNASMFMLAIIALVSGRCIPSARNCLRRPERK